MASEPTKVADRRFIEEILAHYIRELEPSELCDLYNKFVQDGLSYDSDRGLYVLFDEVYNG